jgi:hypothetical protein
MKIVVFLVKTDATNQIFVARIRDFFDKLQPFLV